MLSPTAIDSAKEHFDVVVLLLFLSATGLLSVCLYIIRQYNNTESKTIAEVEKNSNDIIRLMEFIKQYEKTASTVDQHTKDIARLYTGLGKVVSAHSVNHPGQNVVI
jgi:hypothetical protein